MMGGIGWSHLFYVCDMKLYLFESKGVAEIDLKSKTNKRKKT